MEHSKKQVSMLDAMFPILCLLTLLFFAVYFFGDDSSSGPNQIALFLCAGIATIIGLKNGYDRQTIEKSIVKGISLTLGAILILLTIGALIGTWLLSGTVPTLIYFGLKILDPNYFYLCCCLICALVALSIGSSWTVAATIGVALIGIAQALDLSLAITAGAIISGAYFGDKLSPLSDTTNLAPAIAGSELFAHIKHMLWTTVPSFVIALIAFFLLGINSNSMAEQTQLNHLLNEIQDIYLIDWYMVAPLLATLGLALFKFPALPAIAIGTLVGALWATLFQQSLIKELVAMDIGSVEASTRMIWQAMYNGITVETNSPMLSELLSGGGMKNMLNTVWLIIAAMTFGAVMEGTGLLKRIVDAILAKCADIKSVISSTVATAFGTNVIAADQYIAIVIPGRMYKSAFEQHGSDPKNLSRALEDGGTVTSVLIPWNTCGAYMHSVLMVNPLEYAFFCFFNWITPIISILIAQLGSKLGTLGERLLPSVPKSQTLAGQE